MTATTLDARQVVGWHQSQDEWLRARRSGISASDVAAVLGFSEYKTPWEVWAEKSGVRGREVDASKEAIRLGVALEPWLLAQARHLIDGAGIVTRTPHRLYAHPDHPHRLASPDGQSSAGGQPFGIEAKTAGLASGFGVPDGWNDRRAPLGYELQCRWQMHVMGWQRVDLVALVAGLGLRTFTYTRDLSIEADMVAQVEEWRRIHLVGRVEPKLGPRDNALMDATYTEGGKGGISLDNHPDIIELLLTYRDGLEREKAGRELKLAATAGLKRALGDYEIGTVADRPVVTWKERRGDVRWRDLVEDLYELADWDDPSADIERYRAPSTRHIDVKEVRG